MMNQPWVKYTLMFIVVLFLSGFIAAYFYIGTKDNLDDLQKNLGIATGVLVPVYIIIYGLLYVWVQAQSDIFVPLVLSLCFANSLLSTVAATASVMSKQ
jgi:hypothetical protein